MPLKWWDANLIARREPCGWLGALTVHSDFSGAQNAVNQGTRNLAMRRAQFAQQEIVDALSGIVRIDSDAVHGLFLFDRLTVGRRSVCFHARIMAYFDRLYYGLYYGHNVMGVVLHSFGFEWLGPLSSNFDGVEFFHQYGVEVGHEQSSAPLQISC